MSNSKALPQHPFPICFREFSTCFEVQSLLIDIDQTKHSGGLLVDVCKSRQSFFLMCHRTSVHLTGQPGINHSKVKIGLGAFADVGLCLHSPTLRYVKFYMQINSYPWGNKVCNVDNKSEEDMTHLSTGTSGAIMMFCTQNDAHFS